MSSSDEKISSACLSPLTKQDLTDALAARKTELKADMEPVETSLLTEFHKLEGRKQQ